MTTHYYDQVQVVIDPVQSDALQGGGRLQDVSVILTDRHHPGDPPRPPARVALLPCQARDLAFELLTIAEHADRMRTRR